MLSSQILINPQWQCIHFASSNEVDGIKQELTSRGFSLLECDLSGVTSDISLFENIDNTMHFPDYFGNNWDALDECLTDLGWLPANGYVLFVFGASEFWRNSSLVAGKLVMSWLAAAEEWAAEEVPYHLVFVMS